MGGRIICRDVAIQPPSLSHTAYSIPRDKYERALALLQQPRPRPLRTPREARCPPTKRSKITDDPSFGNDTDNDKAAGAKPARVRCIFRRPDGRIDAGERVLRRCNRVQSLHVHGAGHDATTKQEDHHPTELNAILASISACVAAESWRDAVELIVVAARRPQFPHTRYVLFRVSDVFLVFQTKHGRYFIKRPTGCKKH